MFKTTFTERYEANERLVYHVLTRAGAQYLRDEDMVQEAKIGLWKACRTYDPQKGNFAIYAYHLILMAVRQEHRRRTAAKRHDPLLLYLDAPADSHDPDMGITLGDAISDSKAQQMLAAVELKLSVLDGLTERERYIVRQRMAGKRQGEIAREIGVTRPAVSMAIKRIKKRMTSDASELCQR